MLQANNITQKGGGGVALTELAAVRYALASGSALNQPRRAVLDLIRPALRPVSVSVRTGGSVLGVARELAERAAAASTGERLGLHYLIRDIEAVADAVGAICDEGYSPDQAVEQYREIARRALGERLRFPHQAKQHLIVKTFSPPHDQADFFAASGRDCIYLKRDHLFPGLTELATLHENVHCAIRGQGYIPWFDEGVADLLAYLIYTEQTGDASAIRIYRTYLTELTPTQSWYPAFDRTLATLVLIGWQSLLFSLIGARLRDPASVDWSSIPRLLMRGRPLDEIRDKCFPDLLVGNYEFFADRTVQRVLAAILAPEGFIAIGPVAYAILERALAEGDLPVSWARSDLALDSPTCETALQELADAQLAVSNRGRLVPLAGASELVASGMVRVRA